MGQLVDLNAQIILLLLRYRSPFSLKVRVDLIMKLQITNQEHALRNRLDIFESPTK